MRQPFDNVTGRLQFFYPYDNFPSAVWLNVNVSPQTEVFASLVLLYSFLELAMSRKLRFDRRHPNFPQFQNRPFLPGYASPQTWDCFIWLH